MPTPDEAMEDYKSANLDAVKKFYSNFYGASRAELAIVGDFDAAPIRTLTTEVFGDWKSASLFERVPRPYQDVPPAKESLETPDKANALLLAGMNLALRDDDPDYPALVMGNFMFGGGFLNSRLAVRIRQKEGLSYGVGSQVQASPLDQSGSFVTFAIFAPQNVAKVETGFKENWSGRRDGSRRKRSRRHARECCRTVRSTARGSSPLGRAVNRAYVGRTMAFEADFEKRL